MKHECPESQTCLNTVRLMNNKTDPWIVPTFSFTYSVSEYDVQPALLVSLTLKTLKLLYECEFEVSYEESQAYLTFLFRSWLGSVAASSPISRGFRNFCTNFKSGWKAVNASWKTEIRNPVKTMQSINSSVHLSDTQNIYWCENGNTTIQSWI